MVPPAAGPVRPVRAMLTMRVPSEAAHQFEREWAQVARWVAGQHGCVRQTLSRVHDSGDPVYMLISDWSDLPAFRRFERSRRQDEVTAGLRALRTSARMEVAAIVEHREKPAGGQAATAPGPECNVR